MPDPITYAPKFKHRNWIDNEDVVRAGGFNDRFNELRAELDTIADTFGVAEDAVQALQARIDDVEVLAQEGLSVVPVTSVDASIRSGEFSSEQDIEVYPASEDRHIYHAAIEPRGLQGHAQVTALFGYYEESGQTRVTIQLKNEGESNTTVTAQVSRFQ